MAMIIIIQFCFLTVKAILSKIRLFDVMIITIMFLQFRENVCISMGQILDRSGQPWNSPVQRKKIFEDDFLCQRNDKTANIIE